VPSVDDDHGELGNNVFEDAGVDADTAGQGMSQCLILYLPFDLDNVEFVKQRVGRTGRHLIQPGQGKGRFGFRP